LYGPEDAPWIYSCKEKFGNTAKRQVSTVFDYTTAPYSNMVIGEVMNDRGNWSGYIPHHHPQPETYYFMFDRNEGFGASFVGEDVYKIKDGSFSAIPGGKTHPQACAPGYQMYTCWMIRHLDGNPWVDRIDDERYTWLLNAEFWS
jgi:5-deoxy-glucuronate isomerase